MVKPLRKIVILGLLKSCYFYSPKQFLFYLEQNETLFLGSFSPKKSKRKFAPWKNAIFGLLKSCYYDSRQ